MLLPTGGNPQEWDLNHTPYSHKRHEQLQASWVETEGKFYFFDSAFFKQLFGNIQGVPSNNIPLPIPKFNHRSEGRRETDRLSFRGCYSSCLMLGKEPWTQCRGLSSSSSSSAAGGCFFSQLWSPLEWVRAGRGPCQSSLCCGQPTEKTENQCKAERSMEFPP